MNLVSSNNQFFLLQVPYCQPLILTHSNLRCFVFAETDLKCDAHKSIKLPYRNVSMWMDGVMIALWWSPWQRGLQHHQQKDKHTHVCEQQPLIGAHTHMYVQIPASRISANAKTHFPFRFFIWPLVDIFANKALTALRAVKSGVSFNYREQVWGLYFLVYPFVWECIFERRPGVWNSRTYKITISPALAENWMRLCNKCVCVYVAIYAAGGILTAHAGQGQFCLHARQDLAPAD